MTAPDNPLPRRIPSPVRALRRLTAAGTAGTPLVLTLVLTLGSAPTAEDTAGRVEPAPRELSLTAAHPHPHGLSHRGHPWKGHPGRRVFRYTVKAGDTATGLAVRFHAWTAELLAINHLTSHSTLYAGERIRIPVVLAALHHHRHHASTHHKAHHKAHHRAHHPKRHHPKRHHHTAHQHTHPWRNADATRAAVRGVVARTARRHGVNPNLALAIAWQESGWQQRRISSAHAVGVMQVLPATARWMSLYTGHALNPYGLRDNVTAGVVLIEWLRARASYKHTIAGYYQGLGSVRQHGMYDSTKQYVASVIAIKKQLVRGWNPS
ncbi:MAG: lytic transglycosylase [Nocardioidaceae bacterium]